MNQSNGIAFTAEPQATAGLAEPPSHRGAESGFQLSQRSQNRSPPSHYRLNKNAGLLMSAQAKSWTPSKRRFFSDSVLR